MNWGELYAHLIACTGLDWDTIGETFDLPRLAAMNAYWKDRPPVHLMVAAYLGIKPASQSSEDAPDLMQVLEQFPQGMM